ncbi:PQQ-binding-like beta-propeller repeat protein [Novipirellula artificiosorum]|uniref:Outer membrane biogenesis protein BamB n=1 Tax=Novipirellula artificiosorum TaxID=2528016 RepID=A0A5C6E5S8_9BACT|nr:PQQ-binding-like beta-propeller repeat protein [Novipirellula artificiosorum]TWU42479.1 outer membrane biogenesis protein BamB [Novipirellula artificiosorum]
MPNRSLMKFAFSIAIASVCPAAEPDSSWNQWRGPSRDSQVPAVPWPEDLQSSMQLLWQRAHDPSYSGPVVLEGLVFTTETIGKAIERVTAYNLEDGSVAWSKEWQGAMAVPFFAASNGDWIRSTPAVVEGHLVVLGMRDVLVCLDPKTGDEKWRVDFPSEMGTPLPSFGAVCSPLIDAGAIYVQTGGALVKVALADGRILWQSLENEAGMMSSGAFSSPAIATLCGERQLLVQTREELCGVSLDDGTVLWKEPIEAYRGMNILTPLVIGDTVFTSAHSGKAQRFQIGKSEDGTWSVEEQWSQKSQAYMSSPVVIDDTIYLHLKNQRFAAIAVDDGAIRWTSAPFGKYWSMVACGDKMLCLDQTGELLLIQADDEKLNIIDRVQVGSDTWAHLAINNDFLIVRDLAALKVYRWK